MSGPGGASFGVRVERREIAGPPELAGRFHQVRATPWGERAWAHEMLLPRDFAPVRDLGRRETGPLDLLKLSLFRAGGGPGLAPEAADAIDVSIARPGAEVGLPDFLALLFERFALEPVAVDPLDFGGREAVDALVRWRAHGGEERTTRFLVFRHGDALVRAGGTALSGRYDAAADAFAVFLSTLRFVEPREGTFLEPFVWSESQGAIPLGFRRPERSRLDERRDVPWGRQVLDVRLLKGGDVCALIRAAAVDRDVAADLALDSLARETVEGLRATGFAPGPLRQRGAPPSPGGVFTGRTLSEVHEGRAFGGPAEARLFCLESDRALYALAAVLPAREHDRLGWMAGKRALEVAYQSLNRPDEAILRPRPPAPPPPAPPAPAAGAASRAGEEE